MTAFAHPLDSLGAQAGRLARQVLCIALAGASFALTAAPAQDPLLTSSSGPKPNLMLTLDNSGSMSFTFLISSNFPNDGRLPAATSDLFGRVSETNSTYVISPLFHPDDTYATSAYVNAGMTVGGTVLTGKTGYNKIANLWGVRMRSSSFNALYYNPDTTYQPWPGELRTNLANSGLIDANGYPKSYSAVPIDPHSSSANSLSLLNVASKAGYWCANGLISGFPIALAQLTVNQISGTSDDGVCHPSGNSNSKSNAAFTPMVYYRLQAGKTGSSVSDFDEVDINAIADAATKSQQQRNFATWFMYYRTRVLMAKAATGIAFESQRLSQFRLGYGKINNAGKPSADGYLSQTVNQGVRLFDQTQKSTFYSWLRDSVIPSGGTPLRQAMLDVGNYYKHSQTSAGDPYATDASKSTAKGLACRRSFHILVTDGYWNDAGISSGNVDGSNAKTALTSADGKLSFQYSAQAPFKDNASDTLADIAMSFWVNDLRPDLENALPVSAAAQKSPYDATLDPAFWQHMVNYTVGLGVDGTIPNTTPVNQITWPSSVTANMATTVDDLWHAAVNSRGKYLKATDPIAFANELGKILSTISTTGGTVSGVAVSRSVLGASALKFVPSFDPETWSGELKAFQIDGKGASTSTTPVWTASTALPSHDKRNLWMGTTQGSDKALTFTLGNVSSKTAYSAPDNRLGDVQVKQANGSFAPGAPTLNDDLINYLRGDTSKENNPYRPRKSRLGDLINSLPVFLKGTDFEYRFLDSTVNGKDTGAGSYSAFVKTKRSRGSGLVVVGGNDGMLHGFRDTDGVEMFGFIPAPVLRGESHPKTVLASGTNPGDYRGLARLSDVSYEHQMYVDGQIAEGDISACSGSTCNWKNIVVASTGGGAKNVFALDLTTDFAQDSADKPTRFNQTNVLWSLDASDKDLGYMTSAAETGMMANGEWAAVFGNGYDSSTGKAVLMILNANTGAVMAKITAGANPGNGLGGVSLVRNTSGVVMAAYAGDLNGNLWKFDLTDTNPSQWKVDLGGSPLYTALKNGVPQPITAAPNFTPHPKGGLMVIVPTGKLYASSDPGTTDPQTIYGLWDVSVIGKPSPAGNAIGANDPLLIQTVADANKVNSQKTFQVVADAGNAAKASTARGWRLDMLVPSGERGIYTPQFVQGYAYVETVLPGSTGEESCTLTQGSGFGYLINPFTGDTPKSPVIDLDGDGKFTDVDMAGAFQRNDVGISASPNCTNCGIVSPNGSVDTQYSGPAVMRTWRQLFWIPQ